MDWPAVVAPRSGNTAALLARAIAEAWHVFCSSMPAMNFNRALVLSAFFALGSIVASGVSGCASVSSDTTKTSSTMSALVVEVPGPPPEAKDEAKPTTPEPGHIWVAGYWDYINGQHVWRDGRWLAGKPGYEYVRARYEFDGKAWQFHVPHWHRRTPTTPTTVAHLQ